MARKLTIIAIAAALAAFSVAPALDASQRWSNPPFELPGGVQLERDIVFSRPDGHELKLDLFAPEGGEGLRPAIVFIGPGNKFRFGRHAAHMASLGFVGICIEWRVPALGNVWPANVDDAKTAVRWLRAYAGEYRIDPKRIGAAGGSSGGHLVSMLGVTPELRSFSPASEYAELSAAVSAVAAFNSTEDLTTGNFSSALTDALAVLLGVPYEANPELYKEASPISHVSQDSAAFLFLHGTADQLVPYSQSIEMVAALERAGVSAELFTAEGAGHAFFNGPPWYEPTLERMTEFFLRTLGDGAGAR